MKYAKRQMKDAFRCVITGAMIASLLLQGCIKVPPPTPPPTSPVYVVFGDQQIEITDDIRSSVERKAAFAENLPTVLASAEAKFDGRQTPAWLNDLKKEPTPEKANELLESTRVQLKAAQTSFLASIKDVKDDIPVAIYDEFQDAVNEYCKTADEMVDTALKNLDSLNSEEPISAKAIKDILEKSMGGDAITKLGEQEKRIKENAVKAVNTLNCDGKTDKADKIKEETLELARIIASVTLFAVAVVGSVFGGAPLVAVWAGFGLVMHYIWGGKPSDTPPTIPGPTSYLDDDWQSYTSPDQDTIPPPVPLLPPGFTETVASAPASSSDGTWQYRILTKPDSPPVFQIWSKADFTKAWNLTLASASKHDAERERVAKLAEIAGSLKIIGIGSGEVPNFPVQLTFSKNDGKLFEGFTSNTITAHWNDIESVAWMDSILSEGEEIVPLTGESNLPDGVRLSMVKEEDGKCSLRLALPGETSQVIPGLEGLILTKDTRCSVEINEDSSISVTIDNLPLFRYVNEGGLKLKPME